jgi:branched-chain amino acid transport system permease protein
MLAFLLLTVFAVIPFCFYANPDATKLDILTSANLMAILAVSWDLLVGRTGQISLGHALFYGVGAYSTAILFKYFQWPIWITIPISFIVGVGVALIIGTPCLRFKGPYLALLTMAFPISILGFLYYFRDIFGGETGITVPKIFPGFKMYVMYDTFIANYYLSLVLLALSSVIIYKVATSKTGIVFISILDDELGAKACGINITKYKLMSLAISGLFGSLAGAFAAHMTVGSANPRYFLDNTALIPMENSMIPIIATILGGIGTIYGPIIGTYIYYILFRYVFRYLIQVDPHIQIFIFMVVIVALIIKWPRGIGRAIVEKLEDLEEPREIEEIEKERAKKAEKS